MNDKKKRTSKITVRLNELELARLQGYADKMQWEHLTFANIGVIGGK